MELGGGVMRSEPIPMKPELANAIERARVAYNAMTMEQRREMHAAQRKSWVIGNMMLDHPDMSREYAEAIYERVA